MPAAPYARLHKFNLALVGAVVLYVFLSALRPLSSQGDTDFLWHIKQGEHIVQQIAIPKQDPFTFTPKDDELRERGILAWYWLADSTMYAVYQAFDFKGLSILSAALPAFSVLGLLLATYRKQFFLAVLLSVLATESFLHGTILKPDAFSLALAPFAMLLFLHFREAKASWKKAWPLWAIMLLWANLHPGYVLFVLTVWAIAVGDFLAYIFTQTEDSGARVKKTLLLILPATGATLINPVFALGYQAVFAPFLSDANTVVHRDLIVSERPFIEFLTVLLAQGDLFTAFSVFLPILLILTALGFGVTRKKMTIGEVFGVALLVGACLFSARTMPFFILIAGVIVLSRDIFHPMPSPKVLLAARTTALVVIIGLIGRQLERAHAGGLVNSFYYPVKLGEFLAENKIPGNLLNDFTLGNYILFSLYPEYKPFIDARELSWSVFGESEACLKGLAEKPVNLGQALSFGSWRAVSEIRNKILADSTQAPNQQPYWQSILTKYDIGVIASSAVGGGIPQWGLFKLLYDDNWRLVFVGDFYSVFVRNDVITQGDMPQLEEVDKDLLYQQGLAQLSGTSLSATILRTKLAELRAFSSANTPKKRH